MIRRIAAVVSVVASLGLLAVPVAAADKIGIKPLEDRIVVQTSEAQGQKGPQADQVRAA